MITNPLINVDFGGEPLNNSSSPAVGSAAAGQGAHDFWNLYTRDDGSGGWRKFGAVTNLSLASGAPSGAGLTVLNAPGAYPEGSSDAMYDEYVYPFDGGNVTVTVTNLSTGLYDFYVYGYDGNYQLQVDATTNGTRMALDVPLMNPPVWQEGRQYVLFRSVSVSAGQTALLTVRPGQYGYAVISGMQIALAGVLPTIGVQPQSQTVNAGASVSFTVTANGSLPLNYQWRLNGTNLAAATASSLGLANVQLADAGSYSVLVSNSVGTLLSSNAVLTVNPPPPPCVALPLGVVSWWRAESNALDVTGLDNGTPVGGVSYVPGKVGQAFSFNGTDGEVRLGTAAGNFGTNDFTIEFWIQTSSTRGLESVLGKRPACNGDSTGFWDMRIGSGKLQMALMAPGVTDYNQLDATRQINDGVYHHVAFVRQGTAGTLYIDGTFEVSGSTPGVTYLNTSGNLVIGRSACVGVDGTLYFTGQLDEITIYQQALSLAQVQAIYNAGSSGKCLPTAPAILSQPTNQLAVAGDNISFSVLATGMLPLGYQWRFNGTNLAAATASSLGLSNVQLSDAGSYAVLVSNSAGMLLSSNAILTVNAAPPCAVPPAGLVSWWRAEGNALDFAGTNNGQLFNALSFQPGRVGQAFGFDGSSAYISMPASASLNVGTGGGMTLECWVNPATLASQQALAEWNNGIQPGAHFWISVSSPYGAGVGSIYMNVIDTAGNYHWLSSAAGIVQTGSFQHVAMTYDQASGVASLYYNGGLVASQVLGSFVPQTSYDFYLGERVGPYSLGPFGGAMDEMSLYNRALGAAEIQAIYVAERSGKCVIPTPPSILVQPINEIATAGDNISFGVLATGTQPLSYQWRLNGTNLNAATASSLVLTNVQLSAAGSYSVLVSNSAGSLLSSNAVLTVNPPPPCAALPAGLVSWWRGEGSTADAVGGNNGTVAGSGTFGYRPGMVGQAFVFDGIHRDRVDLGNPANLQLQDLTVEAWIKRSSPTDISLDDDNQDGAVAGEGGIVFGYGRYGYGFGLLNNGQLFLSRIDVDGILSTNVVADTNWHHVAVTKSGAMAIFYIDSVPASDPIAYTTTYTFDSSAAIGSRGDAFGGTFWGMVDEPSVYSRALSGVEIQAIYAAERSGKCTAPTLPNVLLQPASQSVIIQSNAVFNVLVTGTSPYAYQWRFNGTGLPGATNPALSLTAVRTDQFGSYDVVITNPVGAVTSMVAVLTVYVPPPPVFTLQPQIQTALAGTNVIFTTLATDTWPVTYQWYFGGTALSGATSTALRLTDVQAANGGDYTVVAANAWNAATSAVATLTVVPAVPWLTWQPQSAGVFTGFPAQLSVAAVGTEPFSYQWQLFGTNIPGATSASYVVSNMLPVDAGSYRAMVTNSAGSATSAEALLALVPVACWGSTPIGLMSLPIGLTNAVAVSAGAQHNLALRRDGTVVAWGAAGLTNLPPGLSNVVAIATGSDHSLALKADGTVAAWGSSNTTGQTNVPANLSNVVAIAAGGSHNLALKADGTVVGWGLNTSGQTTVPAGLTNVVAISAGSGYSIALRADGRVFAWGNNTSGQTNVPANLGEVVAVSAGSAFILALRSDGTVAAWGSSSYGQTNVPAGLANVIAISAGSYHALAVKSDGTLVAWGAGTNSVASTYPNLGQSFIPPSVTNLTAVSAGDAHTLALAGDGAPFITAPPVSRFSYSGWRVVFRAVAAGALPLSYQWQLNGADIPGATGQLLVLDSATNAGSYRVVVTNLLGTATSPGATLTLVDSPPVVLSQPVSQPIFLGAQALLQVTAIGSGPLYYQWRLNGTNIAGATGSSLLLNHLEVSQAGNYSVVISNAWGVLSSTKATVPVLQVAAWGAGTNVGGAQGSPTYGQTIVPAGLNNAVRIAGGGYHTLAVKADGKVLAWGAGTNYSTAPNFGQSMVSGTLPPIVGVAGGLYHSLAVRADGAVAAWGAGTSNYAAPQYGQCIVPANLTNAIAVAAGDYHSVALKRDGTVVAWGYNYSYQTNVPTTATNVIAIAARGSHTLALRSDGSVVHWGSLTSLPPTPYNYVAIAAGETYFLALRNDGTVVSWGSQYPVPTGLANVVDIAAGFGHNLALRSDGTVVTWGATNLYGLNLTPVGLTNVIGIACGYYHSLAFLGDGSPLIKVPPASRVAYLGTQTNFYVMALGAQPLHYQWQHNGTDVPDATRSSLTLYQLQASDAGSYVAVVTNVFGSVTSSVATLTALVPLGQALNANGLVWSTSGNTAWFGESAVTHDGANAAQSGLITDSQLSTLQTTVNGAGTLSFWWKVSSEEWFDYLSFYIDGVQQAAISGEKDWQMQTFALTNGSHTLKWTYAKDLSVSDGADAGWLDQVSFIANPPVITVQPVGRHGLSGATIGLTVAATGAPPLSYQWFKDGVAWAGATSTALTFIQATRRESGDFQVVVSNPGGSTTSSNATLVIRSPQRMGPPMGLPGGGLAFTSGDADGGVLLPGDLPNFQAQATTNFVDWVALRNCLIVTNGALLLVDPDSASYPRRFYRIIELDDATQVTNAPVITGHPLGQTVSMGAGLGLAVTALGAPPLKYQWQKDGINLAGATSASLTISNATRHSSGVYMVVVNNPVGGTPSSNAIVVVRVPEKLGRPQRLADGTFALTAGDADGGLLLPGDLPGFQAQVSTNLVNWVNLSNSLTLTNGMLVLQDPASTNASSRFYRIIEP